MFFSVAVPIVKTLETSGLHLSPISNRVSITLMITMLCSSLSRMSVAPPAGVRGIATANASNQSWHTMPSPPGIKSMPRAEQNTKGSLNFSLKAAEAQPMIDIHNEKIPENVGVRLKHARLSRLL